MATIKDIAKLTGVSTATVSNVLNGKSGAAGEAKSKEIFAMARQLNYSPNLLAKNLKQRKTNTIAIITEDLTVFNTPEIVDGIESFCEERGYEIIIGNMRLFKRYNNDFTDTPKHHELLNALVRNLLAKQVEGIIYVGYHCREIQWLPDDLRVPFVFAYCYPHDDIYPSVLFDDEKAGYDVTKLLIEKGHQSIGVICGPVASYHTYARLQGFQQALFDHRILYNSRHVCYGDWERLSGYRLSGTLLDSGVTAIFAFNDMMASGVYECCVERGLVVGKDISLFGVDNRDISLGYSPPISTVEPPLNGIGRKCAELILDKISSKLPQSDTSGCGRILLPCKVIERKSVQNHSVTA
ncbi:MAG: LacI family transcriptional regulator [Treponema sp.]|jgi:LacI family transcriptional regulator|nr:LacI family transcriptional regulator [Treponema sp.]